MFQIPQVSLDLLIYLREFGLKPIHCFLYNRLSMEGFVETLLYLVLLVTSGLRQRRMSWVLSLLTTALLFL